MKKFAYLIIFLILIICSHSQWREIETGIPEGTFVHRIEPVNENILWACIYSEVPSQSCPYIVKSTDGGISWEMKTITEVPESYSNARITAVDENNAWLAMYDRTGSTSGGIYKTTDGGNSWTQQTTAFSPNSGGFVNGVYFFDSNNGLCLGDPKGGYFEIYTTTNGGDNWLRVPQANIPASPPNELGTVLAMYHYNNNFWFSTLSYPYYPGKRRIFRSTDRGHTWSVSELSNNTNEHVNTFAFENENNGLATNLSNVIAKTTDGGMTWNNITGPDWLSVAMLSPMPGRPGTYFGGSYYQFEDKTINTIVYTTDYGNTWARASKCEGWPRVSFYSNSAGWTSEDNSTKIMRWEVPNPKFLAACPSSIEFEGLLLGYTSSISEISIANFGTESMQINAINLATDHFVLENLPALPLTLNPFESKQFSIYFDPQSAQIISDSITFQSDAGNSMSINLFGSGMEFATAKVDEVYLGGDSLLIYNPAFSSAIASGFLNIQKIDGLSTRKSDKSLFAVYGGNTISAIYQICPETFRIFKMAEFPIPYLTDLAFDNSDNLFAASKSGDLYTLNLTGNNYQLIGNNSLIISGIAFHPVINDLWCCVSSGDEKDAVYKINTQNANATLVGRTGDNKGAVSMSFDMGGNLHLLKGGGLAKNSIWLVNQIDGSGTLIHEFSRKDLFAISSSTAVITSIFENTEAPQPEEYSLSQNYPNPFNPSTKIDFHLPFNSKVVIELYSVTGEKLATLLSAERPAGSYTITIDSKFLGLSSGVYFYKLIIDNPGNYFAEVRKMILLK